MVITGTNLASATAVKFGSAPATAITANTATSVTATSPAGTGTVDVTVTTAGGTSTIAAGDKFTYVAAPTVTSIVPTAVRRPEAPAWSSRVRTSTRPPR